MEIHLKIYLKGKSLDWGSLSWDFLLRNNHLEKCFYIFSSQGVQTPLQVSSHEGRVHLKLEVEFGSIVNVVLFLQAWYS